MTNAEFITRLEQVVGIQLSSYKQQQLVRRLDQFMQKKGFGVHSKFLAALESDSGLRHEFRENVTINTSHFFRDHTVFQVLQSRIIPDLLSANRPVRVWSAGASIGAEVYSIALLLKEQNPALFPRHQLLATDIDADILTAAQRAVYSQDKLTNLPPGFLSRYFRQHATQRDQSLYALTDDIKAAVRFRRHDLLREHYPRPFQLILCRNVLIYFRREAQTRVIQDLLTSLTPGGYLLLGSSEVIFDTQQKDLKRVGPSIYRLAQSGKLPVAGAR